jgi:hypothetical protein
MRSHRWAQPPLSCLVTAIADDPERKHARRWIVHLVVHGTGCATQAWYLCHARLASGRVGCRPASAVLATAGEGEQSVIAELRRAGMVSHRQPRTPATGLRPGWAINM